MRIWAFSVRTGKEILRDPLTLVFGLGFPAVLILLLSAIQANIPVPLFEIEKLAPGMTVFGLSFMTLFSATLIARDKESALLTRLYATPMRPVDFILGYTLPLLPVSLAQSVFCYAVGLMLGLPLRWEIVTALLAGIPACVLFIALGLLFGSVLTQKQVGGICGALLTNLTAWLSGLWFDLSLVGGAFLAIADALPFHHGVLLQQMAYAGNLSGAMEHLLWVTGYAAAALLAAVALFLRQMRRGQ